MGLGTAVAFLAVLVAVETTRADSGPRQRLWPAKTSRVLLTDEQITSVRQLCRTDPSAHQVLRRVLREADQWLKVPDQKLRETLPDSRVPRAFDLSTEGCPQHGKDVFQFGTYPWKLDPDRWYGVICPIGGERYPSNDFDAYYRGGMKDSSLLTGPYPDDGWGWVSPNGEKFWFVAHACHWNWMKNWRRAVSYLAQAYVLTGERAYAHKAVVMLDRIAEIYPGMEYSSQSRYGQLVGGGKYKGKILNRIWETTTLRDLAKAYDMVFDTLIGDHADSLPRRSATEVRANIEANLLEEGIDAVGREEILGNIGMHQAALAYAVVVRQAGPTRELLEGIFRQTGGAIAKEGLDYALYNLVYKDGTPCETSPMYNGTWLDSFAALAQPLLVAGIDLYRHPRMRLMFGAPLRVLCTEQFTPAEGDAGSVDSKWIVPELATFEAAWRHLGEPQYAWALHRLGAFRPGASKTVDQLVLGPLDLDQARQAVAAHQARQTSRVLDGYGMAILNNTADSLAVSMYYGTWGWHAHNDRLNIELFGLGRRLSPDLGYPDAMNAYVSGIYTWSQNTVSHNCLVVDGRKQRGNERGRILRFHSSPSVHVVDVDAAGSYDKTDVYRRELVLVETGENDGYLVDVFRVRGGSRHLLSMHGFEGDFTLLGASLPPTVTQGTLAGPKVAVGELYDDARLRENGRSIGYTSYSGSGYQHFTNHQRVEPESVVTGCWRSREGLPAELRVHVLPQSGQEIVAADALVSPLRRTPAVLKYLLARRNADASGSVFVTVWEPVRGGPPIDEVRPVEDPSLGGGHDRVVALSVRRGSRIDIIALSPRAGRSYRLGTSLASDAAVVVLTVDGHRAERLFAAGGTKVGIGTPTTTVPTPGTLTGTVRTAEYGECAVAVDLETEIEDPSSLAGWTVRMYNELHSCVYTIASASEHPGGLRLTLAGSDCRTGRVRMDAVEEASRTIKTSTNVPFPSVLAGMSLVTGDLAHSVRITGFQDGNIHLAAGSSLAPFAAGLDRPETRDAWVADFGPGDRVEVERFLYRSQTG